MTVLYYKVMPLVTPFVISHAGLFLCALSFYPNFSWKTLAVFALNVVVQTFNYDSLLLCQLKASCGTGVPYDATLLTFSGATIQPSSTVRDGWVILDTELSFGPHVNQLVSRCFHQLRRIKSSVSALPTEATKTVVNSFVVSRIDYCNSLLAGATQYQLDGLQAVMIHEHCRTTYLWCWQVWLNSASDQRPSSLASSPQEGAV